MQGKNICVTHQKRFQVAKLNKVDHTTVISEVLREK